MQDGIYTDLGVRISPFAMLDIYEVDIRVSPNEHASAYVRGTIDDRVYIEVGGTKIEKQAVKTGAVL